jgi:hypothetical protein
MPKGAWFIRPAAVTVIYGKALAEEELRLLNEEDDHAAAEMIRQKVELLYLSAQPPRVA